MANYKVIQNVEAEDKIVWKLSIKQFIFALIAGGLLFFGYLGLLHIHWMFLVIFAILALPFLFLAAPLGKDQPNEVWLVAQLNFLFKPRKRLWQPLGDRDNIKIVDSKTLNDDQKPPSDMNPLEAYQKAYSISQALDVNQNHANTTPYHDINGVSWADSHDQYQNDLHQYYQNLLINQQQLQQQNLRQNLAANQTEQQAIPRGGKTVISNPASFDTIVKRTAHEDLKIATIENMLTEINRVNATNNH